MSRFHKTGGLRMYGPVDLLEKCVLFEYLNYNIALDPFEIIRKCCVDSVNIQRGIVMVKLKPWTADITLHGTRIEQRDWAAQQYQDGYFVSVTCTLFHCETDEHGHITNLPYYHAF